MIIIVMMIIIIKFNFFLRTSVWLRSLVNAILLTSDPDLSRKRRSRKLSHRKK